MKSKHNWEELTFLQLVSQFFGFKKDLKTSNRIYSVKSEIWSKSVIPFKLTLRLAAQTKWGTGGTIAHR